MPKNASIADGLLELDIYNRVDHRRKALLELSRKHGRAAVRSKWMELKRTLNMQIKALRDMSEPAERLTRAQQQSLGLRDWVLSTALLARRLEATLARIDGVVGRGGY